MPRVVSTETGQVIRVASADVPELLAAGRIELIPGERGEIESGATGRTGTAPVEDLLRGRTAADPVEVASEFGQASLEDEFGDQPLRTFGQQAVEGLLLGAPVFGEAGELRAQANPGAATLGTLASIALPIAGSIGALGKVGKVAAGFAGGPGLIMRAGDKVARSLGGGVAGLAGAGLVEANLFTAANTFSDGILRNKPLVAEQVLTEFGLATLLGAGAGAATGGAVRFAQGRAAKRAASEAQKPVFDPATLKTAEGRAGAKAIVAQAQVARSRGKDVLDALRAETKPGMVRHLDTVSEQLPPKGTRFHVEPQDFEAHLTGVTQASDDLLATLPPAQARAVRAEARTLRGKWGSEEAVFVPRNPEELSNYLDDLELFRAKVDKIVPNAADDVGRFSGAKDFDDYVGKLAYQQSLPGDVLTKQKLRLTPGRVPDTQSRRIADELAKKFTAWEKSWHFDEAGARNLLRQPAKELLKKSQAFDEYLKELDSAAKFLGREDLVTDITTATQRSTDAMADMLGITREQMSSLNKAEMAALVLGVSDVALPDDMVPDSLQLIATVWGLSALKRPGVMAAAKKGGVNELLGLGERISIQAGARGFSQRFGTGTGMTGAIKQATAWGTGAFLFQKAFGGVFTRGQKLKAAEVTAQARVQSAVDGLTKAPKAAKVPKFKGGSTAGTFAGASAPFWNPLVPDKPKSRDNIEAYHERMDELAKLVNDPLGVQERALDAITGLHQSSEEVADLVLAKLSQDLQYLLAVAPKDPGTQHSGGISRWSPSKSAAAKWGMAFDVITRGPQAVYDELAKGTMPPSMAQAYRALYPAEFALFQQRVIEGWPEIFNTIQYKSRIALSVLLDTPMDSLASPENITDTLAQFKIQGQQQQQAGGMNASAISVGFDPTEAQGLG